jgi:2-hydroxychromene-2-carboxylate isomerase
MAWYSFEKKLEEIVMTLSFDLFWSFRSPYSYLATKRIVEIEKTYDVKANVRPVYPIAIRIDNFFQDVNPLWPPYLFHDTIRISQMNDIPYVWPNPDPIVQNMETKVVADEQPYIHRLTRLGVAAAEAGHGLAFLDEVSSAIWGGTVNWHEGDHLKEAAARAGVDLAELDQKIEADPDHFAKVIEENETAQEDAGHWGVPLTAFKGECFFGQDRLDHLIWRMKQSGLTERS